MRDPAHYVSYPILAGTIMVLSALRAGARVKVVLSGEPGNSISTDGFIRQEQELLRLMTNYLGTGYAFGIHRLEETFHADFRADRPVHVLIISDSDMFRMLDEQGNRRVGWDVAREALERCGGEPHTSCRSLTLTATTVLKNYSVCKPMVGTFIW